MPRRPDAAGHHAFRAGAASPDPPGSHPADAPPRTPAVPLDPRFAVNTVGTWCELRLDKVLNDKAMLTEILTHHVVGQRIAPADLSDGSFTTLRKGKINTSGSGESFKVNAPANAVCGTVQTADATVYIVDIVLIPTT